MADASKPEDPKFPEWLNLPAHWSNILVLSTQSGIVRLSFGETIGPGVSKFHSAIAASPQDVLAFAKFITDTLGAQSAQQRDEKDGT